MELTYHSTPGVATKIIDGNHTASVNVAPTGNTTFGTDLEDFSDTVAKLSTLDEMPHGTFRQLVMGHDTSTCDGKGGNTRADVAGGFELRF